MHGPVLSQSETNRRSSSSSEHMPSVKTDTHHFLKDGRTISVGDCALFKPPQESPPFIGIIRQLSYSKENNLQLRVNWLYRPAELKLGEGVLLDPAPNEIFYSFHQDDIHAESLLHPCRVAFLPNGVELPSGLASLVCWRVYDIENECLWWLTDQDYIDERQEEVDQLLHKTKIEMQSTVQTGGRSPKQINGPTSTTQLKPGSDCVQNMASFTSQVKGKKRERGDQCSESVKRGRTTKTDDSDTSQAKTGSILKFEIAKITENGGLVDSEAVERLVHLMQPDKLVKKMDLTCRSMLAGVIGSTDKFDCLDKFVQLRGLTVLDEWLQDFRRGKIGDSSGSRDGDRSVEEFLLVLLRALDKLPVNLHTLQICNIGKSVNHLRLHKNMEIQKKARGLVDKWKKRVEAEMNNVDAKSGSSQTVPLSSKSDSHEGNRSSVVPGDITDKTSVIQFGACKTSSSKPSPGEPIKSLSSPPGPVKPATSPASTRDSLPRTTVGTASDVTSTTREDKSSSSSQSLSIKEDAKSSGAGPMSVLNKVSSGGSRHRKLKNGSLGASVSGGQKETGSSRNFSLQRISTSEKFSRSGSIGEKAPDMPVVEGSSCKLIVKIPNQSANGGAFEDCSIMGSQASSPVLLDKHNHIQRNLKDQGDTFRVSNTPDVNAESWQSNDFKDFQNGSDDCDGSPAAIPGEEASPTAGDSRKTGGVSKAVFMSSLNKLKSGKLRGGSFCSMSALIESCVEYSEAKTSISIGDDVGMNLLASVAAGESSKVDLISPTDSPQKSRDAAEKACIDDDARSKPLSANGLLQDGSKQSNEADDDDKKHLPVASTPWPKDEASQGIHASPEFCRDKKAVSSSSEEKLSGESVKCHNSALEDLQTATDRCLEIVEKFNEVKGSTSSPPGIMAEKGSGGARNRSLQEEKATAFDLGVSDAKFGDGGSSITEVNVISNVDVKKKIEVTSSNHSSENEDKGDVIEKLNTVHYVFPKSQSKVADASISGEDLATGDVKEHGVGNSDEKGSRKLDNESENHRHIKDTSCAPAVEDRVMFPMASTFTDQKSDFIESNDENGKLPEHHSPQSPKKKLSDCTSEDVGKRLTVDESKLPDAEALAEEHAPSVAEATSSCIAEASDADPKMKFDLNEGLTADDGTCMEQITMKASMCPSNVQIITSLPVAASSTPSGLPASVTVAAAAKGPFCPPEELLKSKGEHGWKGSASTSAFRPTEPRKVLQMSLSSSTMSSPDAFVSKHGRAPLNFDLNMPDEEILEDLASRDSAAEICSSSNLSSNELRISTAGRSGGLDLDLNITDDANVIGQHTACNLHRHEPPIVPVQSLQSGGSSTNEVRRDFDLNNGPSFDDANIGQTSNNQHFRARMNPYLPIAGQRLNNSDIGNFSSWFTPGNSYSTVPSILPDRTGGPPKIFGPASSAPFTPDVFQGSVLSSSPAVPFPSPFQYPVYPFGATFPHPSGTFAVGSTSYINAAPGGMFFTPPLNSQAMRPLDTVSSQYPRPYAVSLPEVNNTFISAESNRKWVKPGLDLNSCPGTLDVQRREERFLMASNQLPIVSSQSLPEGQARVCTVGGSVLKRKEPEGSHDNETLRYKQSSWQ